MGVWQQSVERDGTSESELMDALAGATRVRRPGQRLLQLLRDYRADVTAPLVAENARLRAELERAARCSP